ncbi:hypothetical protein ACFFGH_10740 [Lysobacter korlensis]|uniref:Abortive infection protein-like C-terminal domain-containing protein n=1 Tax=Lysobacter korlensis TaxID=553636 RepID=A0ABV6RMV4_9GAMM
MPLSQRSVGLIGEASAILGHAPLTTELLKAGLGDGDPGQTDRTGKSIPRDKRAAAAVKAGLAHRKWDELLALAEAVLNLLASSGDAPSWAAELVVSLRADGYDAVSNEVEQASGGFWGPPSVTRTWRILPLGEEDMPLAVTATALARDLKSRGLDIAANHFDQAFKSLTGGQWEAANGQLRSTFENVLVELARKFGWTGDKGGQALDVLRGKKAIDDHEYNYLKGLWGMSHTNGSHPGISSESEAQLRMHSTVGAIRFILHAIS